MLDIKYIRDHQKEIILNLNNRNIKFDLSKFIILDEKRRNLQQQIDQIRSSKKKLDRNQALIIKKQEKIIEEEYNQVEVDFYNLWEQIPNISHQDTPIGKTDHDNKQIEIIGKIPNFSFAPLDHVTLGKKLNILDFDNCTKVAGQKFYYLKNDGVLLELALINYAINKLNQKGFIPIITPDLAKKDILKGSGFNPRDDSDQIYNINNTDLSLIATAEITIGGYHSHEIIDEKKLPLKYVGLSHCFRKEAGSYGQESKGLYRVHQFTKIEMYIICKPEESDKFHQELLNIEKEIFTELEIPFRVVAVCTGDLGAPAYRKFDLEAWMPMKNGYGEITSTSNCTDYQARRLQIKYKNNLGKKELVHTLNGTAIAISRALIAILENNQQEDCSIIIPKVLRPFMGNRERIVVN